jgi:hypothetical protein
VRIIEGVRDINRESRVSHSVTFVHLDSYSC